MSDMPTPDENSTIRALRQHISSLEAQLETVKSNHTASDQLLTQKAAEIAASQEEIEQARKALEQLSGRATTLEMRIKELVSVELSNIPDEDKRESAKQFIEGLLPEEQLSKLEALKKFMGQPVQPPAGNPPPPPLHNKPGGKSDDGLPGDVGDFDKVVDTFKRGGDPLSAVAFSRPKSE